MTVKIEGEQGLREALARLNLSVDKSAYGIIKDLTKEGEQAAIAQLRGKGTDMAHISIKSRYHGMEGMVFTMMPIQRALSIEEGRKPGEEIPFMQAARWVTGNRYLTGRRIRDLSEEQIRQVYAVQSSARTTGTRGVKYMDAAASAIRGKAKAAVQGLARSIERSGGR